MVTFKAHFDGKVIIPDEPVALAPHQTLRITVEDASEGDEPQAVPNREPGRQADGAVAISPDFDDHLGDAFWGLTEKP